MPSKTLFTAETDNTATSGTFTVPGVTQGALAVWGTFDTVTLKLEYSPDGGTSWIDVADAEAVTAEKVLALPVVIPGDYRASLSGGGSDTVSCRIYTKT